MTEAEIIAELTWNVLPSELLGEAIKAVKKLVAEREEARAGEAEAMRLANSWRAEAEQLRMAYGMAYGIPGAGKVVVNVENPVAGMLEIIAQATAEWETLNSQVTLWKAGEPYEKEIDG